MVQCLLDTGYTVCRFTCYSSVPPGKCRGSSLTAPLFHMLPKPLLSEAALSNKPQIENGFLLLGSEMKFPPFNTKKIYCAQDVNAAVRYTLVIL